MLYQVMQRHNFLPEAFTTDFQVWFGSGGRLGWKATHVARAGIGFGQ